MPATTVPSRTPAINWVSVILAKAGLAAMSSIDWATSPANANAAASPEVQASPAIAALLAQSEFSQLQRVGGKFWDPVTEFAGSMAAGAGDPLGQPRRPVRVAGIGVYTNELAAGEGGHLAPASPSSPSWTGWLRA